MKTNQIGTNLMEKKKDLFHYEDWKMKFYQVRDGNNYQVLVQDNSDEDVKPTRPYRYDGCMSHSKPVCSGHSWCLDRCIGIIEMGNKDNIFVSSDTEIIEVEPLFRRNNEAEGYPSGELKAGRVRRRLDVLLPLSNPSEELNQMVGCEDIKQRLKEFKQLADYNKACLSENPERPVMQIFLHSIFYGNPGTGKTTICRLYGSLLKEAGMLSKGHVIVADRAAFSGEYFGDEEAVVTELLNMSRGGILMIDEAYLLEGVHHEDPSQLVLPLLLSSLADERRKDFAVVLCGYKDKLDQMIEQNPGLYSRFVNRFEFKDYSLDELTEIGVRYLNKYGHTFSPDGLDCFREELSRAMNETRATTWANARSVKNMVEHTYIRRAMRYGKEGCLDREISAEDISTIPYERRRRIGF